MNYSVNKKTDNRTKKDNVHKQMNERRTAERSRLHCTVATTNCQLVAREDRKKLTEVTSSRHHVKSHATSYQSQCNSVSRLVAILGTLSPSAGEGEGAGRKEGDIIPVISLVVEVGGRSVCHASRSDEL